MIFKYPKAVKHLFNNGIVATMRTYRYKPNQRVFIKTTHRTFRGRIVDVAPNTLENRLKFYRDKRI